MYLLKALTTNAVLDFKLCKKYRRHHGKIYSVNEIPDVEPPLHERCRCAILPMEAIMPGGATKDGESGIYENDDGHLPSAPGRVWYEADINYYEGRRNQHRILCSNDGLLFVTYDHYQTFYEIYTGGSEWTNE